MSAKQSSRKEQAVKSKELSDSMEQIDLKVMNASGKSSATRKFSSGLLPAEVSVSLLHQYTRWQRNKKRAGTHNVLTRAEARGGGAKPWKQKGTGRARAGSNTSPLWVGGGIAHGPKERSYEFSLNKKERKKALAMAVKARLDEGMLFIADDFGLKEISTKNAQKVLNALGVKRGDTALLVVSESESVLRKSLKNIEGIELLSASGLNVYDILNHKFLIFVGESFDEFEKRLTPQA